MTRKVLIFNFVWFIFLLPWCSNLSVLFSCKQDLYHPTWFLMIFVSKLVQLPRILGNEVLQYLAHWLCNICVWPIFALAEDKDSLYPTANPEMLYNILPWTVDELWCIIIVLSVFCKELFCALEVLCATCCVFVSYFTGDQRPVVFQESIPIPLSSRMIVFRVSRTILNELMAFSIYFRKGTMVKRADLIVSSSNFSPHICGLHQNFGIYNKVL